MKRQTALILALVMTALLLCACGHRDAEEETSEPTLLLSTKPVSTAETAAEPMEQTSAPATEPKIKFPLPTVVPTEETKPSDGKTGDPEDGKTGGKKNEKPAGQEKKSEKPAEQEKKNVHVHNYETTVTAPTCTKAGYTTYTCSSCGHSYTGKATAALDHNWGKWFVTRAATEASEGEQIHTCTVCQKSETRIIDKLPSSHVHGYMATVTPPTCTGNGYTTNTCACGSRYRSGTTPALRHSWSKWFETRAATEAAEGEESRTCAVCGKRETRKSGRLPHTHQYAAAGTAPTCMENGYTTYTCACGDRYTANKVAATGHSWSVWKVTTPATEAAEGEETRTCTACGKRENRKTGILPHTHQYAATVTAPTCTGKGYTTYTCSCGNRYTGNDVPTAGHTWGEWNVTAPATEAAEGEEVRACSVCGKAETRKTDKLPAVHVHNYETIVTPPTCTEEGYTTYTCACGDRYTGDEIPAAGHTWGEWSRTKEPTAEEEGEDTHICEVCGAVETTPVEKLEEIPSTSGSFAVPEIIDIINEYRAEEGLGALTYDSGSQEFADIRAAEICVVFDHVRPNGEYFYVTGIQYGLFAENIAFTSGTSRGVVKMWMASDGHRENMMNGAYTKAVASCNGFNYVLLLG